MTPALASLTLVRRLKAPPARVWAAITRPEQMLQWWGPDAGPTLKVDADVRPGGRFSVVFRMLDGQEYNPTGVYREVRPEHTLAFTWDLPGAPEPETLVTFRLRPIPDGTELTLTHERLPDAAACAAHERGWAGLLDKLCDFLGVDR
jgi:uncharacterized protein YndB with AHSA1/START domain